MSDIPMLSAALFVPALQQPFTLSMPNANVVLILTEVTRTPYPSRDGIDREPFTLLFRGDAPDVMPQSIYRLGNAVTGDLDIFLVPIGRDGDGVLYEAVFT